MGIVMANDDHDISFGVEGFDEAFYSAGDWDGISSADWSDVDFSMDDVMNAFWDGFVAEDMSPDERWEAREEFFEMLELMGFDASDFDWDAWREAMGY